MLVSRKQCAHSLLNLFFAMSLQTWLSLSQTTSDSAGVYNIHVHVPWYEVSMVCGSLCSDIMYVIHMYIHVVPIIITVLLLK